MKPSKTASYQVILRQVEDVPETTMDNLIGCSGYKGPAKSLQQMEEGIAEGARRSR